MATRDYWLAFGSGNPATNTGLAPTFIFFVNGAGQTIAPPSITETYVGTGLYKFAYDATQTISFVVDGATTGLATSDRYIAGVVDPQDLFGATLVAISATQTAIGNTLVALGTTGVALGMTNVALGTSNIALGTTSVALGISNISLGTTNVALGTTAVAIGTTLLGYGLSGFVQGQTLIGLIGTPASSFGTDVSDPTTVFGFLKRAQENSEGNETYIKATGVLTILSRGSSQLLATKTISDTSSQTTKT